MLRIFHDVALILLGLSLIVPIYGDAFPGFVSLVILDNFSGENEKIPLEPGKTDSDQSNHFQIKTNSINSDEEDPSVAWVDLEIHYQRSAVDAPVCVQRGKQCTNQIHRFQNERYILGFDISPYVNDDVQLSADNA